MAERDIGQQLCQRSQSSTIIWLDLSRNSFTGEGIHILLGFIHLCPCMTNLFTNDCGITSDDLIWLLNRLTQLKSSSPNLCNKLELWYLRNNLIDDSGAAALIDHLPSLFPRWGCHKYMYLGDNFFDNNPVSVKMIKRLKEELKRHLEEERIRCLEEELRRSQEEVSLSVS